MKEPSSKWQLVLEKARELESKIQEKLEAIFNPQSKTYLGSNLTLEELLKRKPNLIIMGYIFSGIKRRSEFRPPPFFNTNIVLTLLVKGGVK